MHLILKQVPFGSAPNTEEMIADHLICLEKGQVIKNTDHYRDKAQRIEDLEAEVLQCLEQVDKSQTDSQALCALLKASSPKIYKDQLLGAKKVLSAHIHQYGKIDGQLFAQLIDTPRLTATGLRDRLAAYQQHPDRDNSKQMLIQKESGAGQESANKTQEALARYSDLNGQLSGQGESHVIH